MLMFLCDCTGCGWESPPADTAEAAATAGAEHVTQQHPAVVGAGAVTYLRLWNFQQIILEAGHLPDVGVGGPDFKPEASADELKHHGNAESRKPHEGRKGR